MQKFYKNKSPRLGFALTLLAILVGGAMLFGQLTTRVYASGILPVPLKSGWTFKYSFENNGSEIIIKSTGPSGTGTMELDWLTSQQIGQAINLGYVDPLGINGYFINIAKCQDINTDCQANVLGALQNVNPNTNGGFPPTDLFIGNNNPGNPEYNSSDNLLWIAATSGGLYGQASSPYGPLTVSGASVTGGTSWKNTAGTTLSPSAESANLEFLSPMELFDTKTLSYYTSSATSGTPIFSDGGSRFLSDGQTVYWPYKGIRQASTCDGGIVASTDYANQDYGQGGFYLISTDDKSGSCYLTGPANIDVSQVVAQHYSNDGPGPNTIQPLISADNGDDPLTPDGSNVSDIGNGVTQEEMFYAMFYWESPTKIGAYGSAATLTAETGNTRSTILAASGLSPSDASEQVFTSDQCSSQGTNQPFLLVKNYDSSKYWQGTWNLGEGPPGLLMDTDIFSSNAVGLIYTSNGQNGWSDPPYSQSSDGCLLGATPPGADNVWGNNNSNQTFIGNLAASVGNTDTGDPGAKDPSGGTTPTSHNPGPGTPNPPTCDSSGFSLAFIVCPVINAISSTETDLEDAVGSLLKTPPITFSDSNSTYNAWSKFRDFGNALLVMALLAAVIAEAIGGA